MDLQTLGLALFIIGLLFLLAPFVASAAPADTGTLHAYIYFDPAHPGPGASSLSPSPIAGWPVFLCQGETCQTAYTDSTGLVTFAGLPWGEYTLCTQVQPGVRLDQPAALGEGSATVIIEATTTGWSTFLPAIN